MSPASIISILFISAFAAGISVFFVKRDNAQFLKLILSFSGAYLFAITVLHLIPHAYLGGQTDPEIIGLYILGGFIFQLLLEQFSQGIEHGHIHQHDYKIFPLGILISLCLHAFLEGMPLVAGHQNQLVFGIAIHHIPAAFALGSLLLNTNLSKAKIMLYIGIFAAMTPLGFMTSKTISSGGVGEISQHFDKLMAIVIGIFLHISTTILFESGSADHHKFNRKKMIAIVLGILVSLANFLFDGHDHSHHPHHGTHPHEHHDHDHSPDHVH
ncbi:MULTISPECIES: ZIP family metal transporter [Sphingobacterium]|uniref:ZIP family metal transporter n=1 Tax=Sphingobacterium populi TaxID=1812824 RepID=A0ABW5U839_9SPHI|nr:ZIP family metal transporter [Sphingobacterium sp. CFCC 11742]